VILRPYPFGALVRRMFRELEVRRSIFDLPLRRVVRPLAWGAGPGAEAACGEAGLDLSVAFHGLRASTPFGPAAGPHSQLAQNIVLSWLAGGRIIELKTVQVRDDLVIPRPCIDMETVGFNIEWSQELRLEESLEEYVKAAMLVRLLAESGAVGLPPDFTDTIYDLSVGYDLAGLTSPRVQAFLAGAADATPIVDRLRSEIPAELASLRGIDFPARLARSVTLSTFHGCPPAEIERMVEHLLEAHGLHAVVKLNPMLLGPRDTRWLLNEVLGYHDLRIPERAFERDTTWDQMLGFVDRLGRRARALGLGFGIKLTNTLIVENHRSFFPPSEREMYLSGPPLHVLAIELVRRVRAALGPDLPISFSAGIDAVNFADAVGLGLVPITACTDLLKAGGYGRAFAYFQRLAARMEAAGARTIGDFVIRAFGQGRAALDRLGLGAAEAARCEAALEAGADLRAAAGEATWRRWQREAAALNTAVYADRVANDPRYASAANRRPPRKIGRRLQLFDCLTCDKCLPVCPNDANFTLAMPPGEWIRVRLRPDGRGGWQREEDGVLRLAEKHQIANFVDFCNDCGNCDVFCPEDGGPFRLKPRFFRDEASWRRPEAGDGFVARRDAAGERVLGRFGGREFEVEIRDHHVRYHGPDFDVTFDEDDPEGTIAGDVAPGAAVELVYFHVMRALAAALYAPGEVNYVNCL
jgi:putative selenate reductase